MEVFAYMPEDEARMSFLDIVYIHIQGYLKRLHQRSFKAYVLGVVWACVCIVGADKMCVCCLKQDTWV